MITDRMRIVITFSEDRRDKKMTGYVLVGLMGDWVKHLSITLDS